MSSGVLLSLGLRLIIFNNFVIEAQKVQFLNVLLEVHLQCADRPSRKYGEQGQKKLDSTENKRN